MNTFKNVNRIYLNTLLPLNVAHAIHAIYLVAICHSIKYSTHFEMRNHNTSNVFVS